VDLRFYFPDDIVEGMLKALYDMPKKVGVPLLKRALRMGTKMFRDEVAKEAPVKTGKLVSQLALKTAKLRGGRKTGSFGLRIAWQRTSMDEEDAYYTPFLEYGTKHIAPMGFIRRTFERMKNQILHAMQTYIMRGIDKYLKKMAKKGKGAK